MPPTVTNVGFGMSLASFFWGYFWGYLLTYFNKYGGFGRVAGMVIIFLLMVFLYNYMIISVLYGYILYFLDVKG